MSLKPCPFCGGEALQIEHPPHKHHFVDWPEHPGSWTIECVKCAVGMIANAKADVEAAWNLRASPSEAVGEDTRKEGLEEAARICAGYIERLKQHKDGSGLQTGEDFNVFEITAVSDVLNMIQARATRCGRSEGKE